MDAAEACLMLHAIFNTLHHHPSAEEAQLQMRPAGGTCSTPEQRCGTWCWQLSPVRAWAGLPAPSCSQDTNPRER